MVKELEEIEEIKKDISLIVTKLNEIIAVLQENNLTRKIEVDFIYPEGEESEEGQEEGQEEEVTDEEEELEEGDEILDEKKN